MIMIELVINWLFRVSRANDFGGTKRYPHYLVIDEDGITK